MSPRSNGDTRFDLCDDFGVWIVVPKKDGRWATEHMAQQAAGGRNFEHGVAHASGELKEVITPKDDQLFQRLHLTHPECTCSKETKATVAARIENSHELTPDRTYKLRSRIQRSASRHNR